VAVLDRNGEAAERVARELRGAGAGALGLTTDVTDRAAVDAAFEEVRRQLGPTEILVTSAGFTMFTSFLDIAPEEWNHVFDINVTGTFHCCQAALPDMLAAHWGRIVMISSSSAQRGSPKAPHYAAAKGAVMALSKSLALTFAPHGITVNNIPPSGIETPMQHQGQASGDLPPNEMMAKVIPMGHLGTPDDIAAAATFLASDEAGYITGQTLGVNGGQVVQ
jgi:2-hydroxycyclohexanecarboxyl-CoA dehydrogenase